MKSVKKIGIWMDHSNAHIMKLESEDIVSSIIESQPIIQRKEQNLKRDESLLHNKEHNQISAYYKKLSEIIKEYDEVILFGPTDAKNELLNLLKVDHLFAKIKFEIKLTDKMTENQQITFVKEYFNTYIKN
jgi:hypothetical protein